MPSATKNGDDWGITQFRSMGSTMALSICTLCIAGGCPVCGSGWWTPQSHMERAGKSLMKSRKIIGTYWKIIGKYWKIIGKYWNIIGKYGNIIGKYGKIIGKYGKIQSNWKCKNKYKFRELPSRTMFDYQRVSLLKGDPLIHHPCCPHEIPLLVSFFL